MRERIAVGLGLGLVLGALVAVLSHREPRLAGSNSQVLASGIDLPVEPGRQRCQGGIAIPPDAGALRLFPGTYGKPGAPLEVTLRGTRGETSLGHAPGGYRTGPLRVPIRRPAAADAQGRLCIRNRGQHTVRFAGNLTPPFGGANAFAARLADDIRVDYLREDRESWWQIASVVAERFGLMKTSFFGSWTLWLALGVAAFAAAAGVALVLRQPE